MAVEIKNSTLKFIDLVTVEDAEAIFNKLLEKKKIKIDMSQCKHIHTAILQLLMVFTPEIIKLPEDKDLKKWIIKE
ncbi:hypothetical protein V4D30_00500 [Thermodesulfovibrio sp. 3907-1M]|uniref:STAS domain-containing protein n=1 Tax=Thermodesulfovibrio autotrophicus TaxID=3118333 RepID=A0AAU8GWB8_9BACT